MTIQSSDTVSSGTHSTYTKLPGYLAVPLWVQFGLSVIPWGDCFKSLLFTPLPIHLRIEIPSYSFSPSTRLICQTLLPDSEKAMFFMCLRPILPHTLWIHSFPFQLTPPSMSLFHKVVLFSLFIFFSKVLPLAIYSPSL